MSHLRPTSDRPGHRTGPGSVRRAGPTFLAGVVLLTGCGVPVETSPRPVDPPPGVLQATTSPAPLPTRPGSVAQRLYLVRDNLLVPVVRRVPVPLSAAALLDLLLAGPDDTEQRSGLTSALTGPDSVLGLQVVSGEAMVDIGEGLSGTGRNDEILAFGQIVRTLTTHADVDRVTFRHDGDAVGIPRADGSLSRTPLTDADYADLLAPR